MNINKVINPILKRANLSISDVLSIIDGKTQKDGGSKRAEIFLTKGRGKAIITESSQGYTLKIENYPQKYIIAKSDVE